MHRRRDVLGALGIAGVAALAGCAVLQDTFEQSASPASVGQSTLEDTGFEHRNSQEMTFNRTVDALGQSRDLRLTNWLVTYGKAAGGFGPDAAQFRLFSTPSITVAGNEINPIDNFDDRQLLGQANAEGSGDLDEGSTRTVDVLGEEVEFTRYETQRQLGGEPVTAYVHVGRFSNDGDLLTAIGSHPEVLDETENVDTLAKAVEHPDESES